MRRHKQVLNEQEWEQKKASLSKQGRQFNEIMERQNDPQWQLKQKLEETKKNNLKDKCHF